MEDIESKEVLISDDPTVHTPLKLCSIVFRLHKNKLALRELVKFAAAILSIQFICAIAIAFMRPTITGVPQGRWLPIIGLMPVTILYVFTYANIITGPWGSESSRFWCDVRIMYVRGFNTIRTVLNMLSNSAFIMFLSVLCGNTNTLSFCLILIVTVLSEWHLGLAENVNQYDVKAFDKFMDGDILCLETLHSYQMQHQRERVQWMSFVFSLAIQCYLFTCILATANTEIHILTFQTPIAISIVIYTCLLPPITAFMFLKNAITFSELELYRVILDIVFPLLIVSFSLV